MELATRFEYPLMYSHTMTGDVERNNKVTDKISGRRVSVDASGTYVHTANTATSETVQITMTIRILSTHSVPIMPW